MTTIVIMPGGFHPFHAGHYALYQSAQRTFPDAEVFVAATNDTSARPFPFPVKEKLAKLAGVEPGHFVQVKSPFKAEEITANFDPNKDQLIFVRSEKDSTKPPQPGGTKKDGSPSYLQPLLGAKRLEPFAKHAYMAYLPTVEFGPGMTSATEIRAEWPTLDEQGKLDRVMSLYPRTQGNPKLAATVVGLLNAAIGSQVDEDISRRGFLRGLGAAAVAGAAGSAMAQSQPVDVSQAFANMRKDDPRVQHNKDIDEMARAIYDQMVTLRGQPIDRRQQQMWMTIAREKAAEKLAKYAPGRPAAQPQSSGFPSQGSERRVSRNIDNFESQGVAEGYSNTTFNVDRRKLNVPSLIQKGAIFVTYPHGEQGWETDNKEDWAFSLLSLYNVLQGGWPSEAKKYLKPESYKRAEQQINSSAPNLGSDKLVYDGKYNQILWSIKKLGIPDDIAFLDKGQQGVAETSKQKGVVGREYDRDPELRQAMLYAKQHYPQHANDPDQAMLKWLQRGLNHSEREDRQHDRRIAQLNSKVSALIASITQLKQQQSQSANESNDYVDE